MHSPAPRPCGPIRDLIIAGRARPSRIVSHRIRIDEEPLAYQKLDERIAGFTTFLIKFGETKAA